MPTDTPQRIKVYCLASFTDDEADEILTQLDDDSHHSYSAADVRVDLIPWTEERDGGKEDILRLFLEHQDTEDDFMFFLDRDSLDLQDFLVADVRNVKEACSSSETQLSRYSVIETTRDDLSTKSSLSGPDMQIIFGRCGRDTGWYGNSYSGIKTTYMSLISGRITLEKIVHKRNVQPSLPSEVEQISAALDVCDEAYSFQARLAKRQANVLSCQLQAKSTDNKFCEEGSLSIAQSGNNQNSCCLSGSGRALHV